MSAPMAGARDTLRAYRSANVPKTKERIFTPMPLLCGCRTKGPLVRSVENLDYGMPTTSSGLEQSERCSVTTEAA